MTTLSIIIPAYNEAENIAEAIKINVASGRELKLDFEIITIDDGSSDGTGEIISGLKPNYPELRMITHEVNQGIGGAICTGIKAAGGIFCIFSPADSPYTTETLSPFLANMDEADMVLGYRAERPGYSSLMLFNSWLYCKLLKIFCGIPYRDVNWVHLYRRSIFKKLDLEFTGIVMEAEVVLKTHALGFRIREVNCPMQLRIHGKASAGQPKVMLRTGWDLLRLIWRWRNGDIKKNLGKGLLTDEKQID